MSAPIYLVNIGNTHAEIALLDREKRAAVFQRRLDTRMLVRSQGLAELEGGSDIRAVVACVVPAAADVLYRLYGRRVVFIKHDMVEGIDFSHVDTRTVGADRLANVAAVAGLALQPVVVLDCGTAITTEVINQDGQFLGGVILPGRWLSRQVLNEHTALLPKIPVTDDPLTTPWGNDTQSAIRTGIDLGLAGALERILNESCKMLGKEARMIVTGGDATFFLDYIAGAEAAPSYFSLQGLASVAMTVIR